MGREVHDRIHGIVFNDSAHQVSITGFADDQITVEHCRPESRTQVIQNDDTLTRLAQLSDNMTSDVACTTGDEYGVIFHIGFRLSQAKMSG